MPKLRIIAETGHVFKQDFRILQDWRDWRHLQPSVILKNPEILFKKPASIISGQALKMISSVKQTQRGV
jgi:hypothetical protein